MNGCGYTFWFIKIQMSYNISLFYYKSRYQHTQQQRRRRLDKTMNMMMMMMSTSVHENTFNNFLINDFRLFHRLKIWEMVRWDEIEIKMSEPRVLWVYLKFYFFFSLSVVMHKDKEENGMLSHMHTHDSFRNRELGAFENGLLDGDMFLQVSNLNIN